MATDNPEYNAALTRLHNRLPKGAAEERALLGTVSKMVIRDKLVPPKKMEFILSSAGESPCGMVRIARVDLYYGDVDGAICRIHHHALSQLCARAGIPMTYVNTLNVVDKGWKLELLRHNLNELFHQPEFKERGGEATRYLHRIVDGELRGFLSRRYNRHLSSAPLLRAFSEVCNFLGAKPIEATSTPVRFALKCLLPFVFEAYPGEYVSFGVEWANSDFGAGKQTVSQIIWRVSSGSTAVLDEGISRVHLGSIIEDSDIEMSEETAHKEVEAHKSAIVDTVKTQLSEKTIDRMLLAVRMAHEQKIPWTKLRGQLSRVLSKADVNWMQSVLDDKGETIIDLPQVSFEGSERVPNAYWASSCLSVIAQKTGDVDYRLELQREAGRLLASVLAKSDEKAA